MIMTQKCDSCLHEHICSYNAEYVAACEQLDSASYSMYSTNSDGRAIITRYSDTDIQVEVKCPHRLVGAVTQLHNGGNAVVR